MLFFTTAIGFKSNFADDRAARQRFRRVADILIDIKPSCPGVAGNSVRERQPRLFARSIHDAALAVAKDALDSSIYCDFVNLVRFVSRYIKPVLFEAQMPQPLFR